MRLKRPGYALCGVTPSRPLMAYRSYEASTCSQSDALHDAFSPQATLSSADSRKSAV